VHVEIPPQDISTALTTFAEQTQLQILYASELTEGKVTKGVSGTMTAEDAVRAILADTGLSHTFTDEKTIAVQRTAMPMGAVGGAGATAGAEPPGSAPKQKPVRLPEVFVKDVKERGYTEEEASTASRIPVPVQETPRSIEVVTRQVLDDQKVLRVQDALRNVSGTSMPSSQGGRGGDFMIRGFRSDQSVFKNGFREDSTFGARASRDTANLESIEVLKGPPSYLYGRTDPGGVINQITKKPLRERYSAVDLTIGSYNLYRPSVDLGGSLNDSKTLTYRFNGVYESSQSFREGVKVDRIFLAPTIGWELGPRTTLRFEAEYLHDRSPIDRGIVAVGSGPADIPDRPLSRRSHQTGRD
jgi:iron complex outermembrane receptor protein